MHDSITPGTFAQLCTITVVNPVDKSVEFWISSWLKTTNWLWSRIDRTYAFRRFQRCDGCKIASFMSYPHAAIGYELCTKSVLKPVDKIGMTQSSHWFERNICFCIRTWHSQPIPQYFPFDIFLLVWIDRLYTQTVGKPVDNPLRNQITPWFHS